MQNDLTQCAREIIRLIDSIYTSNTNWIWLSRLKGYSAESAINTIKISNQKIALQALLDGSIQIMAILTIYFGALELMSGEEIRKTS